MDRIWRARSHAIVMRLKGWVILGGCCALLKGSEGGLVFFDLLAPLDYFCVSLDLSNDVKLANVKTWLALTFVGSNLTTCSPSSEAARDSAT